MASKLPKIPQSEEEKQKNAADNEQHAALVAGGASKSKLRKVVCFNFQKKTCAHPKCKWAHICVGCGGSKPYDDCLCLSGKVR